MFPFGRNTFSSPFQTYDPYEQLVLQQELQRRRQAEEYARRRQLEELNRRRAEELEYARRQAELQRRREAETRRRREMEMEERRRRLSESANPRGLRARGPETFEGGGQRNSMFDGGVQDLFDAIYGTRPRTQSPSPSISGRRSVSSDPAKERLSHAEPRTNVRFATDESAVSNTEGPAAGVPPPSDTEPIVASPAPDATETEQVDTSPSRKAVDNILSNFASLKSSFTFPARLDFLPSPEGVSAPAPKLAYTPNNAPLHQYEHLLTGLLTQLDAVESYGDAEVRRARKDAVRQIEQELEDLDRRKLQDWTSQFAPLANESVSEPALRAGKLPEVPSVTAAPQEAYVDPASVPLPHDEDQDQPSHPSTPANEVEPDNVVASVQQTPKQEPPTEPAAFDASDAQPNIIDEGEGRINEMKEGPDLTIKDD